MSATTLEPRKVPKQARAVQTRERFEDAAARVFARHGYSAGTTNRIAAEAGASVGSLYQYFPNKDAILVALIRRHIDEGAKLFAEALAATDGWSLLERLPAFVDAVLANHAGNPRLHQVLFEEAPRPPALLEELRVLESMVVSGVEEMIRADDEVVVADPALTARLVVIAIESLVHRYISSEYDELDLPAFRNEVVAMVSRYLHPLPAG